MIAGTGETANADARRRDMPASHRVSVERAFRHFRQRFA